MSWLELVELVELGSRLPALGQMLMRVWLVQPVTGMDEPVGS